MHQFIVNFTLKPQQFGKATKQNNQHQFTLFIINMYILFNNNNKHNTCSIYPSDLNGK